VHGKISLKTNNCNNNITPNVLRKNEVVLREGFEKVILNPATKKDKNFG